MLMEIFGCCRHIGLSEHWAVRALRGWNIELSEHQTVRTVGCWNRWLLRYQVVGILEYLNIRLHRISEHYVIRVLACQNTKSCQNIVIRKYYTSAISSSVHKEQQLSEKISFIQTHLCPLMTIEMKKQENICITIINNIVYTA